VKPAAHNGLSVGSSPTSRTNYMKKTLLITTFSILCGCSATDSRATLLEESKGINKKYYVNATWYKAGRKTANGEKFNPHGMTAAHKKLPFNTMIRVTNPVNGKSILVRINDRGPFTKGRDLDLAMGAAKAIEMKGTSKLIMEIMPNR
jgi:rare lipoprotein A